MKKLVFLFAMFLVIATGNAQTGNTDVSRGASWFNTGEAGIISKTVWNDKFQTGNYTLRLDGRKVVEIWVLRIDGSNPVKPQVLFKRGYYSRRTGNWLDLKYGQAIWGYGSTPEWRAGISGYEYLVNAVALDECGNLIESARRPVSCTTSVVVQHPTTQTSGCGGCGTQVPTTTTPPVTGGTWPGMTQQPPQPQNFSLPQPKRKKTWLARNWWVIPVGLLASYGAYKILHKPPAPVPTPEPEPGPEPNPTHEPNSRPAPNFGTPASSGGIIFRF